MRTLLTSCFTFMFIFIVSGCSNSTSDTPFFVAESEQISPITVSGDEASSDRSGEGNASSSTEWEGGSNEVWEPERASTAEEPEEEGEEGEQEEDG